MMLTLKYLMDELEHNKEPQEPICNGFYNPFENFEPSVKSQFTYVLKQCSFFSKQILLLALCSN